MDFFPRDKYVVADQEMPMGKYGAARVPLVSININGESLMSH